MCSAERVEEGAHHARRHEHPVPVAQRFAPRASAPPGDDAPQRCRRRATRASGGGRPCTATLLSRPTPACFIAVSRARSVRSEGELTEGSAEGLDAIERQDRLSLVERIAADVAHAIHSPLTTAQQRVELLLLRPVDTDELRRTNRAVSGAIEDISLLVRAFSRLASGHGEEAVDPELVLESVARLCTAHLARRGVKVVTSSFTSRRCASRARALHVLLRVVIESAKGLETGGRVSVSAHDHPDTDGCVRFAVEGPEPEDGEALARLVEVCGASLGREDGTSHLDWRETR